MQRRRGAKVKGSFCLFRMARYKLNMKFRITKWHILRFFKRLGIAVVVLFLLFLLLNWFFLCLIK
ncbi:MAG: hypothetical protein WDO16_06370 [Bacteroidota bacterium]